VSSSERPITLEVRTHARISEIAKDDWNALVGEADSPFVEWDFLAALEDAGCVDARRGWQPCHFTLHDGGKLVAASPAYIKGNSEGEFVFDWSWADVAQRLGFDYYPKLIFAVPFTPATGARVLRAPQYPMEQAAAAFREASIQLAAQAELSSVHVLFPTEAQSHSWQGPVHHERLGIQYHWHNNDYATFEDFLRRMPSKKRTQIRRERAQLERDGVRLRVLEPQDLTPSVVKTMYELYLTTVDKFTWGRRYLNLRFFELLAERFAHRLSWTVAERDGKIIASAFNVQKGDRLYGRYWGSFVELPFLHFNVCFYHGIDHCIRHGLKVFEPGAGGEHKRVRGFVPTATRSVHYLRDPRMRTLVSDFLLRERAAITEHIEAERQGSGAAPDET
jgi:predicted N-acyltransferase